MEMGELTAIALAEEARVECHFDHKKPTPEHVENELKGVGTTLGEKMEQGKGTRVGQTGLAACQAPKDDPKNINLFGKGKPIRLPKHTPESFPLTCAAHHLIPAQASLRDSKLVKWLVHGSISAQVKGGGSGNGKLVQNIGYDVNGSQNGVWLPGPYALNTDAVRTEMGLHVAPPPSGKKRTGPVEVLGKEEVSASEIVPKDGPAPVLEPEDLPAGLGPTPAPGGAFDPGGGRTGVATAGTIRKTPTKCEGSFPAKYTYYFLYSVSAMQKVGAQYHDAHTDYNERVLEALNEMNTKVIVMGIHGGCDKCKEINKERTETSEDFPPPKGLIGALDRLSSKLRSHVSGPLGNWKWPIYTSKMALHYWIYEKDAVLRLP